MDLLSRPPLIQRYEHHGFTGWVVSATRRNKRFTRYYSDHPNGKRKALRDARAFRDKLIAKLPTPTKIKKYICNTTGVIGVSRRKEWTRGGRMFVRYIAQWPVQSGHKGRATFSVGFYGEKGAFRLQLPLDALACAKPASNEFDRVLNKNAAGW
jgi:hypothetical protein